eukprot:7396824-Ditylum_brightwellii.AAC.1
MEQMFHIMHNEITLHVLDAIERRVMIAPQTNAAIHVAENEVKVKDGNEEKEKENWFQGKLGPTCTSSQWHVKQYVSPPPPPLPPLSTQNGINNINSDDDNNDNDKDKNVLLPIHTDPSLISIVIHDKP